MRTLREEIEYQRRNGFTQNTVELQLLLMWYGELKITEGEYQKVLEEFAIYHTQSQATIEELKKRIQTLEEEKASLQIALCEAQKSTLGSTPELTPVPAPAPSPITPAEPPAITPT